MTRKHIVFKGSVQGVGFRWRAQSAAHLYGCTGWVSNSYDGSVVMEVQGSDDDIDCMLQTLENGTFISIEDMEIKTVPVIDERGFSIE